MNRRFETPQDRSRSPSWLTPDALTGAPFPNDAQHERLLTAAFERRGRPNSHTSANRFRTTRYTNDQSKQPSLDHGNRDEPSEPDARESRGRVLRTLRAQRAGYVPGTWVRKFGQGILRGDRGRPASGPQRER